MPNNLSDLSEKQLMDLKQKCEETIETVFQRLELDPNFQDCVRRLLRADSMLTEFSNIHREDVQAAELALQGTLAVTVNLQSVRSIDAEFQRRVGERN